MSKKVNKKERTSVTPHRLMSLASIWLVHQEKIDTKDYTGWRGVTQVLTKDNRPMTITIDSHAELTADHGRLFHYLNSIVMNKDGNHKAVIHINDLLGDFGLSKRWERRHDVVEAIYAIKRLSVSLSDQDSTHRITFMDGLMSYNDGDGTISFGINEEYYKATLAYKERYINIHRALPLRKDNSIAIELSTLLQIRGGGVTVNGEPKLVKEIDHSDIMWYMQEVSLMASYDEMFSKTSQNILRRAFNSLEKQGFPKYKMIKLEYGIKWVQV